MKVRLRRTILLFLCFILIAAVSLPAVFAPKQAPKNTPSDIVRTDTAEKQPAPSAAPSCDDSGSDSASPSGGKAPSNFKKLQSKYNLVEIPTYDGSYQLTHPKVLYFSNGWNGYKYWMSMTPYPYERDMYENPSIVVSNDGKKWGIPAGLKNPVSGIPSDVAYGGHYSDPQLVLCSNTMELWYRYNPALVHPDKQPEFKDSSARVVKSCSSSSQSGKPQSGSKNQTPRKKFWRRANNSLNIYYRKTTTDGIHWSAAEKLLQGSDGYLSMCVNYENGMYKIWYATYGGDLFTSVSRNARDWSVPVRCTVPFAKGLECYHQDMIKYNSEYYLLQTAEKVSNYTFQLYLFRSEDGVRFTPVSQIFPSKDTALWKDISFYRSTLFVKDNKLEFYISLIIPKLKWYITHMTASLPKITAGKAGTASKL